MSFTDHVAPCHLGNQLYKMGFCAMDFVQVQVRAEILFILFCLYPDILNKGSVHVVSHPDPDLLSFNKVVTTCTFKLYPGTHLGSEQRLSSFVDI